MILGGGTGGTLVANRLRRALPVDAAEITVIDRDDRHLYQPGLLFVPFGLARVDQISRPRHRQLHPGIGFVEATVDQVDLETDRVLLAGGGAIPYDVLVVASGAALLPEETEGLAELGRMERVFTFYNPSGASALAGALTRFEGGRLVVNVIDMPIKCPVAPLEFIFLADWYFRQRGIRELVDLALVTPLDGAFTRPVASRMLGELLERRGVEVVTEFNTAEVDEPDRRLAAYDGRTVPFDLAVVVPAHGGQPYVGRSSGLGDALGFVPTDRYTLQAAARPNVFVIGDATDLPASKAGSVTHFEGAVVVENVRRYLHGQAPASRFDGHANCFIESGAGKALLIDFNYDVEPLPGHYPLAIGLPLLRESRRNHLAKLLFQWVYWHVLLAGRELPGISAAMPSAGKVPVRAA